MASDVEEPVPSQEPSPGTDGDTAEDLSTRVERGSGQAAKARRQRSSEHPYRQGDVIAERYRIEGEIGRGGMGVVYRATQLVTNKAVAIKCLFPGGSRLDERKKRFFREARAAARVRHPNVADVYDLGEHDGGLYMVMALLEGESLRMRMRRGNLSEAALVSLLMPALRGLAAAHAHGIVHRDLKPENIFLCDRGAGVLPEAVLLDFGMSKLTDAEPDSVLTLAGAVIGTPQYMAPEQVEGKNQIDARADVYAMAVILYEALAGRRQFLAYSTENLFSQLLNGVPTPLRTSAPTVSEQIERAVMRALARDPAQRQASVEELAREIESLGQVAFTPGLRVSSLNPPAMSRKATPAPQPAAPPPARASRWVLAALLAAVIVVLAVVLSSRSSPTPIEPAADHAAAAAPTTPASTTPAPAVVAATPAPAAVAAEPPPQAPASAPVAKPTRNHASPPKGAPSAMPHARSAAEPSAAPAPSGSPPTAAPAAELPPQAPVLRVIPSEPPAAPAPEPTPAIPSLQPPRTVDPAPVPALQLPAPTAEPRSK